MADIECSEIVAALASMSGEDLDLFEGLDFESEGVRGTIVKASAEGFYVRDDRTGDVRRVSCAVVATGTILGDSLSINRILEITGNERPSQRGVRLLNSTVNEDVLHSKLRSFCFSDYQKTSCLPDKVFERACRVALGMEIDPTKIMEIKEAVRKYGLRFLSSSLRDTARAITHPGDNWRDQYKEL